MSDFVFANMVGIEELETKPKHHEEEDIQYPRKYHVVFHNDDYTPFAFVEEILKTLFGYADSDSHAKAVEVHLEGKAIVGTYSKDIAETKAAQVISTAVEREHPLLAEAVPEFD